MKTHLIDKNPLIQNETKNKIERSPIPTPTPKEFIGH